MNRVEWGQSQHPKPQEPGRKEDQLRQGHVGRDACQSRFSLGLAQAHTRASAFSSWFSRLTVMQVPCSKSSKQNGACASGGGVAFTIHTGLACFVRGLRLAITSSTCHLTSLRKSLTSSSPQLLGTSATSQTRARGAWGKESGAPSMIPRLLLPPCRKHFGRLVC